VQKLLRVEELALKLGEVTILKGVSFQVAQGATVGIIGPNGCGKTTLFNCLNGFHRSAPGTIFFRGADISASSPYLRARSGLGRVFQNSGVFRSLTLYENLLVALEARDRVLFWNRQKVQHNRLIAQYLSDFGLSDKAHDKASSLSGGQLRLLEIARSVAVGAELLLLDEPTAGVSPKMKGDVERVLRKLVELGKTVVVIEHDINFIQNICQRILVMDQGRIVLDDSPVAIRSNPALQDIYFGGS